MNDVVLSFAARMLHVGFVARATSGGCFLTADETDLQRLSCHKEKSEKLDARAAVVLGRDGVAGVEGGERER